MTKRLIVFPGSKQEYQDFRKYEVKIVELKCQKADGTFVKFVDRGITLSEENGRLYVHGNLVEEKHDIEAIVNATPLFNNPHPIRYYGLPVAKK